MLAPVPRSPTDEAPKYLVISRIGRGGMAEVFLAVAPGPGGASKLVVLKHIWPELAADPDFVTMFLDEGRLAVRLQHPNVVHTYEVGRDGDRYFIAMEYLEGQSFRQVLNRLRPDAGGEGLELRLQLQVLSGVLSGLEYAHNLKDFDGQALQVVHRDVCPQNVFITYDGAVKLMDFGIAKTAAASHQTKPGVLKGRLAYMAPEQLRGGPLDGRADLFSVGVMLWEAFAGRRLWDGLNEAAIVHRLTSGAPIPPPGQDVPPGAASVCARALALDPRDRFTTAAEMQLALRPLLAASEPSCGRPLGAVVADAFAKSRAAMQTAVAQALRAPLSQGRSLSLVPDLPSLGLRRTTGSFSVGTDVVDALAAVGALAQSPPAPVRGTRKTWLWATGLLLAAGLGVAVGRERDPRVTVIQAQPATEAPATEAPATEAPVTEAPVTDDEPVAEILNDPVPLAAPAAPAVAAPPPAKKERRKRASRRTAAATPSQVTVMEVDPLRRPRAARPIDHDDPYQP